MLFPSTACLVQERLQAKNAAAFDAGSRLHRLCLCFKRVARENSCFLRLINTSGYWAEIGSRMVVIVTANTAVLFGDGAGAALIGCGNGDNGMLSAYLGAEGSGAKNLYMQPAAQPCRPAMKPWKRKCIMSR
jgi:3-oxoacyl-[acyl-carrier-protein] synthase-3